MIDWTKPMAQSFSYYAVDDVTWRDSEYLDNVVSCKITRTDSELRESASFVVNDRRFDEEYIRAYLDVRQGDESDRIPLGTFLCQTPKRSASSTADQRSVVAYSSLIELRDAAPGFGWPATGDADEVLSQITGMFRPPLMGRCEGTFGTITADDKDTWLSIARAIAAPTGHDVSVDEYGRYTLPPIVTAAAARPSWTFTDDNSSIMLPEYEETFDWYKLPNVCRLVWSEPNRVVTAIAMNDSESSRVSTVNRGREVTLKVQNPDTLMNGCTQEMADIAAQRALDEASAVEISYVISHGYCPVRVGDSIRINYGKYGVDVIARVTEQEIDCKTGLTIRTTAKTTVRM